MEEGKEEKLSPGSDALVTHTWTWHPPLGQSSKAKSVAMEEEEESLHGSVAGEDKQLENDDREKIHASDESHTQVDKGPPWWRSQRYILAYFLLTGQMNIYFQRINFSIAIVCMVNHTAVGSPGRFGTSTNQSLQALQSYDSYSSNQDTRFNQQLLFALDNSSSIASSQNYSTYSLLLSKNTTYRGYDGQLLNKSGTLRPGDKPLDSLLGFGKGGGQKVSGRADSSNSRLGQDASELPEEGAEPEDRCSSLRADSTDEEKEDGPLEWDKQTQGLLLGAVYWTYLALTIPGTHLVAPLKKKHVIIAAMAVTSGVSFLFHGAALLSPWAVFVLKLVQGGCTALLILSMYAMWVPWAPPTERAGLLSLSISGQTAANVLVFPISAFLCKYGLFGGWPSVFYVFGLVGFVWLILFAIFTAETPATHKFITEKEKVYITSSLPVVTKEDKTKPPYCSIIGSPASWAIICLHVSFTWGLFLLISTLPQYMFEVLKFDIKSNGLFSMLPYIALMCTVQTTGQLSDLFIRKKILSVLWARRLCVLIGNVCPAVLLSVLSLLDCSQPVLAVGLLTAAVGTSGFTLTSIMVCPFDIAPRFATPLMSISNCLATIPGILTPYVVSAITVDQTREQWQIVFFVTSGILILGAVAFCVMGKAVVQPWADGKRNELTIGVDAPVDTVDENDPIDEREKENGVDTVKEIVDV
ncbi:uncharacterized transporter slc-17.2 [Aplysia californica]|uniref:Uncharacterized transporter slc-17.2 n=1 Tax=Aplysia californica TaxID=6500 RepID=A0ABM1A8M1_APLCA|nr:uncharacterized transporter slc-17.2 [Aplysia californica]